MLQKPIEGYQQMFDEHASMAEKSGPISQHQNIHQLIHIPSPDKKKRPRKRCRVCWVEGKRKDTPLACSGCLEFPGLCSAEHFEKYHDSLSTY